MSTTAERTAPGDVDRSVKQRTTELLRSNEALREDLRKAMREIAELTRRLNAAVMGGRADRESRRAALNLLEDAVGARHAEQRENLERQRAEEELRNADRRKDEFLATLAHELRNPLAPLRNSLHILRVAGADGGGAEHIHEMMERQVDHMVRLVDDLMEVSRITRGKIELRKENVDLAVVVRSAIEACKPLIETARHNLSISLPTEILTLHADPMRLGQILANLLNNAIKYTEEGGQIWLTARRDDGDVVVSVRDSGMGIPPEMLSKVFELFTQIDRTLGRAQGGLGIGLSLVRRLVDLHGGSIEAYSDGPGRGSEFVLRLPLASGQPATTGRDQPDEPRADICTRRILVVDDNHDAADSLATLLKFLGSEVNTAYDGPNALDAVRSFRPSVVLLDIGMPAMDGNEVARRIRHCPEGKGVTLIALTGWGQEEDRRRSKEYGFDHHLVKPVDLGTLEDLLANLSSGVSE